MTKINVKHQVHNRDQGYPSIEELEAADQDSVLGSVSGGTLLHSKAAQAIELATAFDSQAGTIDMGDYAGAAGTTLANNGLVHVSRLRAEFEVDAEHTRFTQERVVQKNAHEGIWDSKTSLISARKAEILVGIDWKNEVADCAALVAMDLSPGQGAMVQSINAFVMRMEAGEGDDFRAGSLTDGVDYMARLQLVDLDGDPVTDESAVWTTELEALQPSADQPSDYIIIMGTAAIADLRFDYNRHFMSTDADEAAEDLVHGEYKDVTSHEVGYGSDLTLPLVMLATQAGQEGAGDSLALGANDRLKRAMAAHMEQANIFHKWIREEQVALMLDANSGLKKTIKDIYDGVMENIECDVVMGVDEAGGGVEFPFEGGVLTIPTLDLAHVGELRVYINGLLANDEVEVQDYIVSDNAGGELQIDFAGVQAGQGPQDGDKIIVEIMNKMTPAEIAASAAKLTAIGAPIASIGDDLEEVTF